MTADEIIIETLQYYLEDPSRRAVTTIPGQAQLCRYETIDGRRCAVGRCLLEKLESVNLTALVMDVRGLNFKLQGTPYMGLEAALKPEYRGQPLEMWLSLQQMHDDTDLWRSEDPRGKYRALAEWLLVHHQSAYEKAVELGLLPEVRYDPCEA